jgi:hypothetical protein
MTFLFGFLAFITGIVSDLVLATLGKRKPEVEREMIYDACLKAIDNFLEGNKKFKVITEYTWVENANGTYSSLITVHQNDENYVTFLLVYTPAKALYDAVRDTTFYQKETLNVHYKHSSSPLKWTDSDAYVRSNEELSISIMRRPYAFRNGLKLLL